MARAAALALVLVVAGFVNQSCAAGCGQFFVQRAYAAPVRYYQPVYYQQQAFVQPYVAPLYYKAGESIEREAIAELTAEKLYQKLQARGLPGGLAQQQAAPAAVFQKCTKCHDANSSLNLVDGIVTSDNFARWNEIAGHGIRVPKEMQNLIAGMQPEQKGAIADELLRLWATRPAASTPTPAPAPDDAGGLE